MRSVILLIGSVTLVTAALLASDACAQIGFSPYGYGAFGYGGSRYGSRGYGFGGGTLAGNYMQGMAQVIRSEGQYNYFSSQAAINYEEARSKYLDNQKKWRQNYLEMKEQRQYREVQQRDANRQTNEARAAAVASNPPVSRGLGPNSLDPLTGRITWPELLLGRDFEAPRTQIDQLFELRAKTCDTAETSAKIHFAAQEMLTRLRREIEKITANQYLAAHKFLNALDYSARYDSTSYAIRPANAAPSPSN